MSAECRRLDDDPGPKCSCRPGTCVLGIADMTIPARHATAWLTELLFADRVRRSTDYRTEEYKEAVNRVLHLIHEDYIRNTLAVLQAPDPAAEKAALRGELQALLDEISRHRAQQNPRDPTTLVFSDKKVEPLLRRALAGLEGA